MDPIEPWTAPDGRPLLLRPVRAQDAPALAALIETLSPRDRRWRFHGAVAGLSAAWLARLTGAAPLRQVALVAATSHDATAALAAEVRCVAGPGEDDAEFALTVAPAWRRIGLGAHCLAALRCAAARQGLRWLHGSVLADNAPMLALMRRCGFRCTPHRGDGRLVMVELRVDAPPAAGPHRMPWAWRLRRQAGSFLPQ